jgi:hypothetical protein
VVLVLVAAGEAFAQASSAIPRTPVGKPDFHGVWTTPWTTTLERDAGFTTLAISPEEGERFRTSFIDRLNQGDALGATFVWDLTGPLTVRGEVRSSFIVDPPDGKLPYSEEGRRRRAAFRRDSGADDAEQRGLTERCLMAASGYAPFLTIPASNLRQIVQTRDHVVFLTESFGQLRLVPLDGHTGPVIPRGGVSKGRWEGDTLVIETADIQQTHGFRVAALSPFAISSATRITERLSLIGPDEILYRFTVEDAVLYTRPWTGESALRRSRERVFEWACHEGNYSLVNILRGERVAEERAAKGAEKKEKQ